MNVPPNDEKLDRARGLVECRSWQEALTALAAIDRTRPLEAADLELLGVAAYMIGDDGACVDALTKAHRAWLDRGAIGPATRCVFWIGLLLLLGGQLAPAHGWFTRGQHRLAGVTAGPMEAGYLDLAFGLEALMTGDYPAALVRATDAAESGERSGDADLATLGLLGRGQALIATGRVADGVALLDAAMATVTAGEVSAPATGIVYCAVIEECRDLFDIRRAQEWTTALGDWCDSQTDMVPYRGQCLVHRAELLRLHGSWDGAFDEARRAAARLCSPAHPAAGAAYYQLAELYRLRGQADEAERSYRLGTEWGHGAQPGLALLRLSQGRADAGRAAIEHALDGQQAQHARARLLAAYVEILLATDDVAAARAAVDDLIVVAQELGMPTALEATTKDLVGAVLLAEGDARLALRSLRAAWTAWHALDAPYDAARARTRIALACRLLGDEDTAELEFDVARQVFARLGAVVDLTRLDRLRGAAPAGGLSAREMEVLGLVATGQTNREIAAALVISDKTVARHVSNIFAKLGMSSRAAATAYAYEHQLV